MRKKQFLWAEIWVAIKGWQDLVRSLKALIEMRCFNVLSGNDLTGIWHFGPMICTRPLDHGHHMNRGLKHFCIRNRSHPPSSEDKELQRHAPVAPEESSPATKRSAWSSRNAIFCWSSGNEMRRNPQCGHQNLIPRLCGNAAFKAMKWLKYIEIKYNKLQ